MRQSWPRLTTVVFSLSICCLLLISATQASAKPRKKSRKHKETAAQAAERQRREAAARFTLYQVSISPASSGQQQDSGFSINSAPGRTVRGNSSAASATQSNAQFVGDPEAAARPVVTPAAGSLLISEFRLRGPNGANDEFIEIYNDSDSPHTVAASSGSGYAIAASDAVTRCTIPNGTVIPARGHFLCVNSGGYSLASYPSGNGTTATGDATYTTDIPDNAGIALFNNNSGGGSFSVANRFDAVGSTSEANTIYKEGAGYPDLVPFSIDYSWLRDECGKAGSTTLLGPCPRSTPKDTDDNAADFVFVDTNGTCAAVGCVSGGPYQRLGAPGPQNLSSPIQRNSTIVENLLDATVSKASSPNQVRDLTSSPGTNSTFGTLSFRRRFVNNTGGNVTRLRFRIIDLTTFPAPAGSTADLRPLTSGPVVVSGIGDPPTCAATGVPAFTPCTVTVQGTTLEQPPNQPNGGGFNSTLSAGTVTLATPLASGASLNLQFLVGIQQTGSFKIYVNIEALP
jgi:hypothetical protein